MKYSQWLGLIFTSVGLLFSVSAQAQKTYRCGSVYQDRPCDTAQPSKEVRNVGAASAQATGSVGQIADQQCKQRGNDSQKIVWARQSGTLADKLIADVATKGLDANRAEEEKDLILAVYQKPRGSAVEVRAAIEADCMEAKKQVALAASLIAAAVKLQGKDTTAVGGQTSVSGGAMQSSEKTQASSGASGKVASSNTSMCSGLTSRIDPIKASQRTGGSVTDMESWNRQRRAAEAERTRAGC